MSEQTNKKQWALQYAAMGLSVFPVKPQAKAPATAHGFKDATQDSGQIEKWWSENPDYNIGLATGETAPGIFVIVIDIDRDSAKGIDGQKSLEEYVQVHGALPVTVESRTPRGGRHLLFKCYSPIGCKTNLYPGVDVRGVGGYIVAPPSVVNQREYQWVNPPVVTEIAEADSNVYTFLSPVPDGFDRTASTTAFQMPEEIGEGNRTNSLLKLVGSMQAKGLSDEAIRAAVSAENETRCNPPLTEQELESTVFPALTRWKKGTAPYAADRDYSTDTAGILAALMELHPEKNGRYGWHDAGNGNLFSDLSRNVARFVPERKKWYCYDGTRWAPDVGNTRTMNFCKTVADALMSYTVQNIVDEKLRTDYMKHVSKWQGYKYRETILKDAGTVAPVSVSEFDQNKYLFNCQNGTLNLRTGDFREHDCNDLITKLANVEYRPGAVCERWERFINEIMCGDSENSDKVGQFITECLLPAAQGELHADIVHKIYQDWCWANGFKPEGFSEFKKSLASAGIEVKRARPKDIDKHNGNKVQLIFGYELQKA